MTLTNSGTDTLKLDTVILETVRPATPQNFTLTFKMKPGNQTYALGRNDGSAYATSFRSVAIPAGQSWVMNTFYLDVTPTPVAKRAAGAAVGDTMQARLIFKAQAGRGSDTLIVNGIQQFTSIRLPGFRSISLEKSDERLFDLRGRKVEKIPEGARVPMAPLVSPKD